MQSYINIFVSFMYSVLILYFFSPSNHQYCSEMQLLTYDDDDDDDNDNDNEDDDDDDYKHDAAAATSITTTNTTTIVTATILQYYHCAYGRKSCEMLKAEQQIWIFVNFVTSIFTTRINARV